MVNKICAFLKRYEMVQPGDRVICAVSGGADSMALLRAMYLLKEKLQISLSAAHFNHHLRGEESNRDEAFVTEFCEGYGIPLYKGEGNIVPGAKGLEAAAREARYAFLHGLPGKIATAHTADDNAETLLMHLIRGTGLKGLGGISPVLGNRIRPMLTVTRQEVLAFLESYHISYVEDSSNREDTFLRNRLRHKVMPLLKEENPRLAESLTEMALGLREDEALLETKLVGKRLSVSELKEMPSSQRARVLGAFLENCGVKEPQRAHIRLAEELVFSQNPSAKGNFPGGIVVQRKYDLLEKTGQKAELEEKVLLCPGQVEYPELGIRIVAKPATETVRKADRFVLSPVDSILVRSRKAGDEITLSGGTKTLKALFVDRKIPQEERGRIPVLALGGQVLGVWGIGGNFRYMTGQLPGIEIRFEKTDRT